MVQINIQLQIHLPEVAVLALLKQSMMTARVITTIHDGSTGRLRRV